LIPRVTRNQLERLNVIRASVFGPKAVEPRIQFQGKRRTDH